MLQVSSSISQVLAAWYSEIGLDDAMPQRDLDLEPEVRVRFAKTESDWTSAWYLAYQIYREKEYVVANSHELWYSAYDQLDTTVMLRVERNHVLKAAVTLIQDSPAHGLPADDLYGPDLDVLRNRGRRLCELASLVCRDEGGQSDLAAVKNLFRVAFLKACYVDQFDDFIITVNPRHAAFYRKVMLFEKIGDVCDCPKVNGAPAVLLRLNLPEADRNYYARYAHRKGPANLHQYYFSQREPTLDWIRAHRRSMSKPVRVKYFQERKPPLSYCSREDKIRIDLLELP